jgi:AcrR family transcriptional regulator
VIDKEQNVKENILEKSMTLFLTNGYVGTSIKDLTDAVGIARGTLYWHFKSKDQILDEILNRYFEQFVKGINEVVNDYEGDFLAKFYAFYRFITEFARDHRELLTVFDILLGEISRNGTKAASKMKEIRSELRIAFEELLSIGQKEGAIDSDIDVKVHAHVMMATFTGMLLHWFVHEESLDAVAYSRAFRKEILMGLGSEKGFRQRKAEAEKETQGETERLKGL